MALAINYHIRLLKTRKNVLEYLYNKKNNVDALPPMKSNDRLKMRFTEAKMEAQEICSSDESKTECTELLWEIDELEDSLMRLEEI